ncbi:MAG: hypothetical protein J7559_16540 [Cohnella sp.]|nr:hypothetical protein [Cohnella sp.]
MPKIKSPFAQPLLRKSSGEPKAKLSARQPRAKSAASSKNKKKPARADIVHLHDNEPPSYLNRPIPWWVPGTRGSLHPGGPGHPPHHPGPGSHPPGPFPPPHPHPFPPGPGPFPVPVPFPIPIPGPQPLPGPSFITVTINGGSSFQGVNYTNFVPFYPGITIRQALASTGIVGFGPLGFINSVAGIPIIGGANVRLRYNGRVIPQTLLSLPADPGSWVGLELYYALTDAIPIPL